MEGVSEAWNDHLS